MKWIDAMRANDAADPLAGVRKSLERAIADLRAFSASAGSEEMKSVMAALDMLGMAYSSLRMSADNPAWEND